VSRNVGGVEAHHRGPEEANEFTSDGDRSDLGGFPEGDSVVDLVESVLSLPGVRDDVRGLALLT
jgi:hypothetical protein